MTGDYERGFADAILEAVKLCREGEANNSAKADAATNDERRERFDRRASTWDVAADMIERIEPTKKPASTE